MAYKATALTIVLCPISSDRTALLTLLLRFHFLNISLGRISSTDVAQSQQSPKGESVARRHKRIICANKTHPSWDYGNRTRVSEPPLRHTCLDSATFPFRPSPYKWRRSRVGLHCCDSFAPCIAWVLPQLNHLIVTIFNVLSRRLQKRLRTTEASFRNISPTWLRRGSPPVFTFKLLTISQRF